MATFTCCVQTLFVRLAGRGLLRLGWLAAERLIWQRAVLATTRLRAIALLGRLTTEYVLRFFFHFWTFKLYNFWLPHVLHCAHADSALRGAFCKAYP